MTDIYIDQVHLSKMITYVLFQEMQTQHTKSLAKYAYCRGVGIISLSINSL